jgi:tetratricopeptide (TPR) repeat protein
MATAESHAVFSWLPSAYSVWGWIATWEQQSGDSIPYLERSVHMHESLGLRVNLSEYYRRLAEALLLARRFSDARQTADRGLALARELGERAFEAHTLLVLGEIASESGDFSTSGHSYQAALSRAIELGLRPLIAHCHLGLGKLYRRTGKREQAQEHLTAATTMYREMDMQFWLEQAKTELKRTSLSEADHGIH